MSIHVLISKITAKRTETGFINFESVEGNKWNDKKKINPKASINGKKKEQVRQGQSINGVNLNQNISIIALNVYRLTAPVKR